MGQRIEDYAMIGDGQTAALIGIDGSVDWLCWPRFDSPSCFARLLGDESNGRWLLHAKSVDAKVTRRFQDRALILETHYETVDGAALVIDFLPAVPPTRNFVRLVRGLRGSLVFTTELVLRPNYGAAIPWVSRDEKRNLHAVVGPDAFVLRSEVDLLAEDMRHVAEFTVKAGTTTSFTLSYHMSYEDAPHSIDPESMLASTRNLWLDWTQQSSIGGPYCEIVLRSLIVLRALIYQPSGAIIAAPTSSLPEELGGERNWDYRYCWLRDATLTLLAMMNGGFADEAKRWRQWLLRAIGGDPSQVQIMYGIGGEQRIPEITIDALTGYENSKPVRVGNAAAGQLQIDIYGEVLDVLYQSRKRGLTVDDQDWPLQLALLAHLETTWREKDEGIWEVRGGRQHFVYSKVMAWVAFDRAIRSVEDFGLAGPVGRWRELRQTIHDEVCTRGWNETVGAFTQFYGSERLDASVLLVPLTGFLAPDDQRIRSTIEAVERTLMKDGFVQRYIPEGGGDGLTGGEGAFIACSFWFVDNLVLIGRHDEARAMFERLISIRNDLGLMSEEYDTVRKRMIGNFPQAFSHIALINSACNLSRHNAPAEQRSLRH